MIHPLVLAAMSGQPILVDVTGGSFTTSTLTPTDAVCSFRLNTSGDEQADEGLGFANIAIWLLGGSASDYECRYSPTGDTGDMTGDSINTWLALSSTRTWTITNDSVFPAIASVTGPLDIGLAGENSALVSGTLTITGEESA